MLLFVLLPPLETLGGLIGMLLNDKRPLGRLQRYDDGRSGTWRHGGEGGFGGFGCSCSPSPSPSHRVVLAAPPSELPAPPSSIGDVEGNSGNEATREKSAHDVGNDTSVTLHAAPPDVEVSACTPSSALTSSEGRPTTSWPTDVTPDPTTSSSWSSGPWAATRSAEGDRCKDRCPMHALKQWRRNMEKERCDVVCVCMFAWNGRREFASEPQATSDKRQATLCTGRSSSIHRIRSPW